MKPWKQAQASDMQMNNSHIVGAWPLELSSLNWEQAMHWLDKRMKIQKASMAKSWNDHWNNYARFCNTMEPYITLCYAIKHGDTRLLRHTMKEIYVILQAPAACKPKYARAITRQLNIIYTKSVDPILQEVYLANALGNPHGLPHTIYEMDLLPEHQNGEFKRLCADRGSSLQETDEMFRLHALSVDALHKVRLSLNRIVVGRQRGGNHPIKDALFDILSLANQLYRSKSTIPDGPSTGIYFSENQVPDLLKRGKKNLHRAIDSYNDTVFKNNVLDPTSDVAKKNVGIPELVGQNENVNELFNQERDEAMATSDLSELYL